MSSVSRLFTLSLALSLSLSLSTHTQLHTVDRARKIATAPFQLQLAFPDSRRAFERPCCRSLFLFSTQYNDKPTLTCVEFPPARLARNSNNTHCTIYCTVPYTSVSTRLVTSTIAWRRGKEREGKVYQVKAKTRTGSRALWIRRRTQ